MWVASHKLLMCNKLVLSQSWNLAKKSCVADLAIKQQDYRTGWLQKGLIRWGNSSGPS